MHMQQRRQKASLIGKAFHSLNDLFKVVEALKELSEEVMDPSFDLEHPLNAYRFIRNHTLVYNQTVGHLFNVIDAFQKGMSHIISLFDMI